MPQDDLIERLAAHRLIGSAPRPELEWVAAHGRLRRLERGDILSSPTAGAVEGLYILLTGHIVVYRDRINGREKMIEWHGGEVTGMLPYSRLGAPPGDVVAVEPTELLMVHRDDMQALTRECHALTSTLVHAMVDRARHFTSTDLHQEKMASLGKLSAGLAHELNNPAAAIARSARALREAVVRSDEASRAVGGLALEGRQLAAIERLRSECLESGGHVVRTPLEQADREEALERWLTAHGCDVSAAEVLAETSLTIAALDDLARTLGGDTLEPALRWLAATCIARHLADEIEQAATRISHLVEAVKGFTHMDHSATPGPVDVAAGLTQTLAILKSKARNKAASVTVTVAPGLPPAHGITGELNQIWANLIDNALDAVDASGAVAISATSDDGQVVVTVADNGPGIPPDIQRRIFDPFFTTKKVGQGTGLGLDIVNRIVRKHRGEISVTSTPGRTEFTVSLPIEAAPGAGGRA
jgi:signal transduction histidine kinase